MRSHPAPRRSVRIVSTHPSATSLDGYPGEIPTEEDMFLLPTIFQSFMAEQFVSVQTDYSNCSKEEALLFRVTCSRLRSRNLENTDSLLLPPFFRISAEISTGFITELTSRSCAVYIRHVTI